MFAELLPHAQTAFPPESAVTSRLASFLGYSGNYAAVRILFRRITEARTQAQGAEHPETLTARANLAHWTPRQGVKSA